jgi:hypothetical protein
MLAIMPLDLFPNYLLFIVIALGFVDANLAALLGAWLYGEPSAARTSTHS